MAVPQHDPFDPEVQLFRKALLTPTASREGLRTWCRMYIGLDFPDVRIDPDSTGSPLDTLWEVYDAFTHLRPLKLDDGNDARRMMMYASRDSFKTLGASVLELLAMVHGDRNVVHLASIEQQAGKAQEYLAGFFDKEHLDEFLFGNNKRTIAVCWFEHKETGDILTLDEWKTMGGRSSRHLFIRHSHYVKVIVNTPQSANSDHTSFMVVDEVDLIRFPKAYDEAKLIPSTQTDVYGRKQPAITVLTSTRKSSGGLVQKEIDEAKKTKTVIRHWNVLDVTKACPPERHKPLLPKLKVWVNDETLDKKTPEEYEDFKVREPKKAEKFAECEAFAGCAKCSIYPACKGRLVEQSSTAGLLKEVDDTIAKFDEVSGEMAIAQLLCRKPGNEGAIYPNFSREKHMLGPDEMYEAITGEPPPGPQNKESIVRLLQSLGAKCATGMDFGYTHCFAVVTGWVFGRIFYVLDYIEVPGLELSQCIDLCDTRIKKWNPEVWPDVAYPAYIKTFRKNGYRMHEHKKDVQGGIEAVRAKMAPVGARRPEFFLLRDDPGCEQLAKRLTSYKWMIDQAGRPTDVPDETDDDGCDATRYVVQNNFQKAGKVISPPDSSKPAAPVTDLQANPKTWMSDKISELTGSEARPQEGRAIRRGGFFADFG